MHHKIKKTNENETAIDLEDKTLFEYVLELDQLEKLINNVGPADPAKFGKMEAFDDDSDTMSSFIMYFALIFCVIIIFYALLTATSCDLRNDGSVMLVQRESFSPEFLQGARAIFIN